MCCGLALLSACGLSQIYEVPTGGAGAGVSGGSGIGGSNGGSGIGGSATGGNGVSGSATVGGNGPGGATGTGGASGTGTGGSTGGCGELSACDPSVGCTCGGGSLSCVYEPLENGYACEHLCQQTSDCPTPYTVCTGTSCTLALCGIGIGGPASGTLDGTCNSEGQNDGTCFPASANDGGVYGICSQGGTAVGNECVSGAAATRDDPGELCPAGSFCAQSNMGPGDTCYTLCNPDKNGIEKCADAGFSGGCFPLSEDPPIGACY
jgi:hypothetical protein